MSCFIYFFYTSDKSMVGNKFGCEEWKYIKNRILGAIESNEAGWHTNQLNHDD